MSDTNQNEQEPVEPSDGEEVVAGIDEESKPDAETKEEVNEG